MTEAKFTPGPWTYSTHSDGWSYTIHIAQADDAAYTPDWSDVAFATCRGERQQIQEANARLIAAAPELLSALQAFMECPYNLDEETIPSAGIEAAPMQVVGTMSVALMKRRRALAAIAKATGEQA